MLLGAREKSSPSPLFPIAGRAVGGRWALERAHSVPPQLLQLWLLGTELLPGGSAHLPTTLYCSEHLGLRLEHRLFVLAPRRADTIQKGPSVG